MADTSKETTTADSREEFSFEQLNGKVMMNDGTKIENVVEHIKGKYVMLYFSAHWCPPCVKFTPTLAEFYTKHHDSKNFEIIFISYDRDEKSFVEYYKEMPCLAVEFGDSTRELRDTIGSHFSVAGIPRLLLMGDDGAVKIDNARLLVSNKPDEYPWQQDWKK